MKASDLFVKQLEEEGVKYIFGLPGEETLDLLESLRKSKIKVIITRHEQAAAFMAATYGRLTGKAGVCFSTLGPGATNLITGIAQAQFIGAPLISISGQKAVHNNRQGKFQLVDVVNLMKPITKKSLNIMDPGTIPTILHEAFKLAESERPGAVHIELAEDIACLETDAKIQKRGSPEKSGSSGFATRLNGTLAVEVRTSCASEKALLEAVKLIEQAKNPLIIVSSGGNRNQITPALLQFIEKSGIYVLHTQMGKGVIADDHYQSLFGIGMNRRDYINTAIDKADLLITIGYNIVEYPPYVWNKNLDKKILNIDFTTAETDRYFNPDLEVVGDISASLNILSKKIAKKRTFSFFAKTRSSMEKMIEKQYGKKYPLLPPTIVQEVQKVMAKDDIIALDNGIYKLWFARHYKTYKPNTILLDNALATMGAGLPSAMAAKLLNPQKKVLAVCGDGGFMMNSQELETAIRCKLPIVVLILNDNAYGFIKWKQYEKKLPEYAMDYQNPDFVKYAESYGAEGYRIEKGDDLSTVLKKAFATKKVCIIDCPIDYALNFEVFSKELAGV